MVSSGLIEYMDNDDQIIAALLHEVGHNTLILENIIDILVNSTIKIAGGITILDLILWSITIISKHNISTETMDLLKQGSVNTYNSLLKQHETQYSLKLLASLVLLLCFITFISMYFKRRQEIYADEFAIKCGYGKPLYDAVVNINKHGLLRKNKGKFMKINGFNIFDYVLYILNGIFGNLINVLSMFKLGAYPDAKTRERYIKEKTEQYDISDKNIDRTKHIDNRIFK